MVKNPPEMWETWVWSLGWEDPLEEGMATHPVFLPGESHEQRSLVGYSPWDRKESGLTEWLTLSHSYVTGGFPGGLAVKNLPVMQETQVQSLGQEDPLENKRATHPVFLPGESHGQRNLVGHSPCGYKELDTTEWLTLSLWCILILWMVCDDLHTFICE